MRAKPILVVSSSVLVACGVAALFGPQEIAAVMGLPDGGAGAVVVQLLGGSLFAFGLLNWLSRFSVVGGIYGRPLVAANLALFFTAATTLGRFAADTGGMPAWVAAGVSGVLAAWFGRCFFVSPRPAAG